MRIRRQISEFGSRARRRPIGRDYAAAKDAECGKKKLVLTPDSRILPVNVISHITPLSEL
jgi:hypothetical protein